MKVIPMRDPNTGKFVKTEFSDLQPKKQRSFKTKQKKKRKWKWWVKDIEDNNPKITGDVYFLRCENYVKIGYSNDIRKRISGIHTSNPFPLELLDTFKGGRDLEGLLHEVYTKLDKHHKREWFIHDGLTSFILSVLKTQKETEKRIEFLQSILEGPYFKD